MMKSNNKAHGMLLQPLEIPLRKWVHVATYLVTDLLEANRFMVIVVFVEKLTKMVNLAGCKKEVRAMEYALIFVDNVFWLHSLPKVIVLIGILILLVSFGERFLICSVWNSGSVLHFIHTQMVSQSRWFRR